jgi:hypothetical protein
VRPTQARKGETARQTVHASGIDVVVPFTTAKLARIAFEAAARLSQDLNATLRLLRIQVVPTQLSIDQSPVGLNFLHEQLAQLNPEVPALREVRLVRDFKDGLKRALSNESIVVLATKWRPWRTNIERLAASLRRDGFRVLTVTVRAVNRNFPLKK